MDRTKNVTLNSFFWKLLPLCKIYFFGASRCECGALRCKEKSGKTVYENKLTNKLILELILCLSPIIFYSIITVSTTCKNEDMCKKDLGVIINPVSN